MDLSSSKSTTQTTSLKFQIPNYKSQTNPNVQNPNIGHWSLEFGISASQIITTLSFTALLLSLYAIYQHFTGFGIPPPWDVERRVTSIFAYPNALGLFLAPLIPLFISQCFHQWGKKATIVANLTRIYFAIITVLSITAIIFAKSTGAMVGVGAGLLVMIFLHMMFTPSSPPPSRGRIKVGGRLLAVLGMTVLIIATIFIVLRSPLRAELLLRDWSGHVRRTQWSETIEILKDTSTPRGVGRPILGAGLAGYKETLAPYHKATYLEIFEYPHNIVLNFWSETGLLGLIAFLWLIIVFFRSAFPSLKIREGGVGYEPLAIAAIASMTTLLIHGLVDVPYFKNDLAVLFWIILALGLTSAQKSEMMSPINT